MKKTRIYISGAQSVGKTTLCRELGKHLDYQVIPEAARNIINQQKLNFEEIALDIAARDDFQRDVTDLHLLNHEEAIKQSAHKGFVFDRSLDYLVYAAGFSTVASDQFNWERSQKYIDSLKTSNALVVLLEPHEELMKQDDVRSGLTMRSAYEVTFGIKVLLEIFDIPYVHIHTPNTLERVKLITNIVRGS